jgi:hypothetical protein
MLKAWVGISCLPLASWSIRSLTGDDRLSYGCQNYQSLFNGVEAIAPWKVNILTNTLLPQTCKIILIVFLQKDQFQFNVCGEGGEYESAVFDCPLFKKYRIVSVD